MLSSAEKLFAALHRRHVCVLGESTKLSVNGIPEWEERITLRGQLRRLISGVGDRSTFSGGASQAVSAAFICGTGR